MSEDPRQKKLRRATTAMVRRGGAPFESEDGPLSRRTTVRQVEHNPGAIAEAVQRDGTGPDRWQDDPQGRALALSPLLEGRTVFGLARLGTTWQLRTGNEKLDFLLSLPDPEATVQALACEEFVFLAKDIGNSDCAALLTLASPEQLQATVDLDAWPLDRFSHDRFAHWLSVVSQAGTATVDRFVASQATAVLTYFVSGSVRVFEDREEAEVHMTTDREVFTSPDGAFVLIADPEDDRLPAVRILIDSIYRIGVEYGRRVLRAIRWELPASLEDDLQDRRDRRVATHGFTSRYQAREAYDWSQAADLPDRLDVALAAQDEPQPDLLRPWTEGGQRTGLALSRVSGSSFLSRALEACSESVRQRLEVAFTRLAYRIQSARAAGPAEIDELHTWTRHAVCTCDIGLESLCGGDLDKATAALEHIPLVDLFRAGHGAVVRLHHSARRLRRDIGGDEGLHLLDDDGADKVRALLRGLPELATGTAMPDSADESRQVVVSRPFESLAEVRSSGRELRRMNAAVALVRRLADASPIDAVQLLADDLPNGVSDDLRLSSLVGTVIAWTILDGKPRLLPLAARDVQRFLAVAFDGIGGHRKIRKELRAALIRALVSSPHISDDDVTPIEELVAHVLGRLDEELGGLDPTADVDPRFVGTAVAVRKARPEDAD